jgi:hypothetical protein
MLNKVDSKNDIVLEMFISNYEEFSFIDSSLQCHNENEDCEQAVVERIKTSEDRETGKDDTTEHEGVRVQILVPIS